MRCIAATVHNGHTHLCEIEPAPHPGVKHMAPCDGGKRLHRWDDTPVTAVEPIDEPAASCADRARHRDHDHGCERGNHHAYVRHGAACGDELHVIWSAGQAVADEYHVSDDLPVDKPPRGGAVDVGPPEVTTGSDEGAPVPDVAGALRAMRQAQEAGWAAVQTYAVASVSANGRKPAAVVHTVSVRISRTGEDPLTGETVTERGYVTYIREDKLVGADGIEEGTWKFGDAMIGLKKWGARQIASRLAKPPGWADTPEVPDPHAVIPDSWGGVQVGDDLFSDVETSADLGRTPPRGRVPRVVCSVISINQLSDSTRLLIEMRRSDTGARIVLERHPDTEISLNKTSLDEAAAYAARPPAALPVPQAPPPVPGTWGAVHAGDVITGADGRGYRVLAISASGRWVGSSVYEVRIVLARPDGVDGPPITLHRPANEPAHVAEHADHTEAAQAYAAITDAGMAAQVIEEKLVSVDQFSAPAPARREPPIGKYKWYKLPHPVTGDTEAIWPRVSTICKTMTDSSALEKWAIRKAIKGLATSPDLIAAAAALDVEGDARKLDEIADQAANKAGRWAGANMGTALDKFTERLDAGESIAGMGVPEGMRADVEAYAAELKRHGLIVLPNLTQRTGINVDHEYGGSWDRVVQRRDGQKFKLDLKTDKDLSYGWFKYTVQLAMYANLTHMSTMDFTGYEPMPEVDKSKGLLLHVRDGKAQIYGLPIDKGWRAALLSLEGRRMVSEARSRWHWLIQPENPADVVRLHIDRATDPAELSKISLNAHERGIWTDDLAAYALARYDLIRVGGAPDTAALAALWDELHPAGRWTEAVNAAAAKRWEALNPSPVAA